jgi:hypothetical protein
VSTGFLKTEVVHVSQQVISLDKKGKSGYFCLGEVHVLALSYIRRQEIVANRLPLILTIAIVSMIVHSVALSHDASIYFPDRLSSLQYATPPKQTHQSSADTISLSFCSSTLWSYMLNVVVVDSLAYGAMFHGLMIFDVSDPTSPETLSTIFLQEGWTTEIAVEGQYVYITEWGGGSWSSAWESVMYAIDVSNPRAPFVAGSWSTPSSAYGVDVRDGLAYVVYGHIWGDNGLLIMDVSDPSSIIQVGDLPMDVVNPPFRVRVRGDCVYLAATRMYVVNVFEPVDPQLVSQYRARGFVPSDLDVRHNDTLIFVAYLDALWPAEVSALIILNAADPDSLEEVSRHEYVTRVLDVDVTDSLAFVTNSTCGLQILDISDPTNPDSIGLYEVPGTAMKVAVRDSLAFLVDGGLVTSDDIESRQCFPHFEIGGPFPGDFQIINVADPTQPKLTGFYSFPGPVTGVTVSGDVALALNDSHTDSTCPGVDVTILDISDKKRPLVLGTYVTPGIAQDAVILNDTIILLAAGSQGLEIITFTDRANPELKYVYDAAGGVGDVYVYEHYSFLPALTVGIVILDISDPVNPEHVVTIPTSFYVWSVVTSGSYLYAATLPPFMGDGEILVYDISEAATPQFVDVLYGFIYNELHISGTRLIAGWAQGFTVFDISSPDTLVPQGNYWGAPGSQGLCVYGNHVLITDGYEGVEIIDVSDMMAPTYVGKYDTPGYPIAITTQDKHIYVADKYGLIVLEDKTPTDVEEPKDPGIPFTFTLSQNYPNPFNAGTIIQYELQHRSRVRLQIFDVLGRLVGTQRGLSVST